MNRIVAIVLFSVGGLYSLYEGIHKVQDPHPLDPTWWWLPLVVLVVAIGLESFSLRTAVRESNLVRGKHGWVSFIRRSKAPELPVVLLEDVAPVDDPGEWAALLPTLDPTTMGWRGRDFHLDPAHARHLFDSNGNGGTTAWLDGRIVGAWVQDADARVVVVPLAPLNARDHARLDEQAERLTGLLDGVVIANVYKSALMKGQLLP